MTGDDKSPAPVPPERRSDLVELPADLVSGDKPVPIDVYDEAGMKVVRRGDELPGGEESAESTASGLYCLANDLAELFAARGEPAPESAPTPVPKRAKESEAETTPPRPRAPVRVVMVSPWERMLGLLAELDGVLRDIAAGRGRAAQAERLARRVQSLCTMDADAALAGLTQTRSKSYGVRHGLRVASVVELVLRRAGLDEDARASAISAALTMNVGMLELQDALYSQREPLDEAQRAEVKRHPIVGAELLRAAGATDARWLDFVEAHHEHADGTGYPRGLREPKVGVEVQAIALADRYCAMISERGYRPGAPADRALALLLERLGTTIAPDLGRILRIEAGDFPPGCVVHLASGEIGVVYRRLREPGARVVKTLVSSSGKRLDDGPRRLTTNPRFAITSMITAPGDTLRIDPAKIWDSAADPEAGSGDG